MKWNSAFTDYITYLKIEKGLAKNSIDSYSLDVKKLLLFLEDHQISVSPISISSKCLRNT